MADDDVVALNVDVQGAFAGQFGQQVRVEAAARQTDPAEFLGIDQAPGAVVLEHHVVLGHDLFAPDVLHGREVVADHLEYDVEVLEREAGHHEAAFARRAHEAVLGGAEVPVDLPEALGLALLGATEHREQLGHRLVRQHRAQEQHGLADALEVHVEIGAREAEQDCDIALAEHDGIDQHAAPGIAERERERQHPALAQDPAHDVGPAHLVEDGPDDLDLAQRALLADLLQAQLQVGRDMADAALEIPPRRAEPEVRKQFLEQQLDRTAIAVAVRADLRVDAAQRIDVEREELDRRIDADGVEQPPRDRVEEGLQEFRVGQARRCFRRRRALMAVHRSVSIARAPRRWRSSDVVWLTIVA